MKIVADENIPFAGELFAHFGEVTLLPGREIENADVKKANILLVRSVTSVNAVLLEDTPVEFVGTCTIGVDHLDQDYLTSKSIAFHSAPGCNALGVVQYVFSALARLDLLDPQKKVAIIGCGNVGGRLYRYLRALGCRCLCIDPYKTKKDIPDLAQFEDIYDADIVCMHTPLVTEGEHPTEAMLGYEHFRKMKPGAALINAGRGECIDNSALRRYLAQYKDLKVVLDVWAGEPNIDTALARMVDFGTPHIAGYSYEGKVNGSTMIFEALGRYLNEPHEKIQAMLADLRARCFGPREKLNGENLKDLILKSYDLHQDHAQLQAVLDSLPTSFDRLRKHYAKRREFTHYLGELTQAGDEGASTVLAALGFR